MPSVLVLTSIVALTLDSSTTKIKQATFFCTSLLICAIYSLTLSLSLLSLKLLKRWTHAKMNSLNIKNIYTFTSRVLKCAEHRRLELLYTCIALFLLSRLVLLLLFFSIIILILFNACICHSVRYVFPTWRVCCVLMPSNVCEFVSARNTFFLRGTSHK